MPATAGEFGAGTLRGLTKSQNAASLKPAKAGEPYPTHWLVPSIGLHVDGTPRISPGALRQPGLTAGLAVTGFNPRVKASSSAIAARIVVSRWHAGASGCAIAPIQAIEGLAGLVVSATDQ
jgi:hypothetical protein